MVICYIPTHIFFINNDSTLIDGCQHKWKMFLSLWEKKSIYLFVFLIAFYTETYYAVFLQSVWGKKLT